MKINLNGIIRQTRKGRILDIPQWELNTGSHLVLTGPNGAGKTTLLRVIAGIDHPENGEIRYNGEALNLPLRRRIGLGFQDPLPLSGTVQANLEAPLRLRGISAEQRNPRVQKMLKRFGLEKLADRSAVALSAGELRRVALARTLVTEPEILLLDEPFTALDDEGTAALQEVLSERRQNPELSTLLVVHDRNEAANWPQELHLEDGKICCRDS